MERPLPRAHDCGRAGVPRPLWPSRGRRAGAATLAAGLAVATAAAAVVVAGPSAGGRLQLGAAGPAPATALPPPLSSLAGVAARVAAARSRRHAVQAELGFDDVPVSGRASRAVREGLGFEVLTEVQARTIRPVLDGQDVLVKANTGAGKTLSFLLPTVERLAGSGKGTGPRGSLLALVLSPVRELTMQIHREAAKLASFYPYPGVRTLCLVGGTPLEQDVEALAAASAPGAPPLLLVATPGRLEDHLTRTPGFAESLGRLCVLVLDEADQLAGAAFAPVLQRILEGLPAPGQRQTLLFSATMGAESAELVATALRPEHLRIDLGGHPGGEAEAPGQIVQTYRVVATEDMSRALWEALQVARERAGAEGLKAVVLSVTARVAEYYASVFRRTGLAEEIFEIHSRRPQAQRTEESDRFRAATRGVLFTSDVSARGLDYPGVAEVIQVGAPDSREDYLHRLGRTGRAGRAGRGLLLLHDFERGCLSEALADLPVAEEEPELLPDAAPAPAELREPVAKAVMAEAYYSWLNHKLRNNPSNLSTVQLVREAGRFAASIGALGQDGRPPRITERNAAKMGLGDIRDPSLNVVAKPEEKAVEQSYQVVSAAGASRALWEALQRARARDLATFKVVVFCIAPSVAAYFAELARQAITDVGVFEVHSKISKNARKKELQSFKQAATGVLFSADASPGSLQSLGLAEVLQLGAPVSAALHGQRLSLASKASRPGRALLLLHASERELLLPALAGAGTPPVEEAAPPSPIFADEPAWEGMATNGRLASRAYYAWLEHYCAERFAEVLPKLEAVREAKNFADAIGACGADGLPPPLAEQSINRLGLAGIDDPALNAAAKN